MRRNTRYGKGFEDYLEAIYRLKLAGAKITVTSISKDLNVKPSSVVEQLEKLSRMKLIIYRKRSERRPIIMLTKRGERIAKKIYDKHSVLKKFLMNILKLPEEIAEIDACSIEHYLHRETVERLSKLYDFMIEEFLRNPTLLDKFTEILKSSNSGKTLKTSGINPEASGGGLDQWKY
ncbi:MAG: metal-dependent transcriptional regulator [Sulfolobales archaeon]